MVQITDSEKKKWAVVNAMDTANKICFNTGRDAIGISEYDPMGFSGSVNRPKNSPKNTDVYLHVKYSPKLVADYPSIHDKKDQYIKVGSKLSDKEAVTLFKGITLMCRTFRKNKDLFSLMFSQIPRIEF